jgi:hypothetical protein
MTVVQIPRVSRISRDDFAGAYLSGDGVPVIVADAIDDWPARSKWTFEYFRRAFGADIVMAPLGLGGEAAKILKLESYLEGLGRAGDELPGFWVDTRDGRPLDAAPHDLSSPLYLLGWGAFRRHPELYEDIRHSFYFADDWMASFDTVLRELFEWASGREYWAIYIGPIGSSSKLHQDFWQTHTSLSQIQGRKRLILFAPGDGQYLYGGDVDPEQPDLERYPLFARATPHQCVLAPGETLFMPPDWWHYVRSLDHSITLSHSFFNHVNGGEHLKRVLRKAPSLPGALADHPQWREWLGISYP